MKRLMTIAGFVLVAMIASSFTEQGRWVIDEDSKLLIHGATNVNSFKCMLSSYRQADTLEYVKDDKTIELKLTKNKMCIPVQRFDCGNKQITKDFWHTLKSERYPNLEILFRSFRNGTIKNNAYIDGVVDITLAGATKRYVVKYHARVPNDGTILLTGIQSVNFSDFKLEPPQKMMGLIQVQECLEVEFNLKLKALQ